MLRIGSAQMDITPTMPFLMGGSFKKFQSRVVLDPLMASCVVADDGSESVAYVSCDIGTMPRFLAMEIREKAARDTGIPAGSIHVMTTHNHSGPTTRTSRDAPLADDDEATLAQVEAMRQKLVDDIAASVIEAHSRLAPARMGYGRGRFDGGASNRRFIMSNGRSRMHGGERDGLKRLKPEGPADKEVQVVWFEDAERRPVAVMVNYTSHVTNFYGKDTASADFPGVMRSVLQGVLGEDVPVLYLQGACGNIMCQEIGNPRNETLPDRAMRIGRGLAGEALKIMADHCVRDVDARVAACSRTLEIPYRDVPPMPFDKAEETWAYYKNHWEEFLALDLEERAHLNSTLRIAGHKKLAPAEETEIAAFAIGDVFFVTNPAELFVEFQLDIKERFRGRKVIVTELTNGWIGYVPTQVACALGGYETIQTRFNPGAGDLIRDTSCDLLEELMAL